MNQRVNKPDYPFDGSLLYSFIHEDAFYFIRGDKKFVYREQSIILKFVGSIYRQITKINVYLMVGEPTLRDEFGT